MTLYITTIIPTSNFASFLQGDTLFGQICWLIRYKWGENQLETLLEDYEKSPFLIISDGFTSGYLPKPSLPTAILGENLDKKKKKENRKKVWLTVEDLQDGNFANAKSDADIGKISLTQAVVKNAINYKSFTTKNGFDPYSETETYLVKHDIYALLDETKFSLEKLNEIFKLLGEGGYGKNSTIGKGRFEHDSFKRIIFAKQESTTFMMLSNVLFQNLQAKNIYYTPITKFGKHGGDLATHSPFKKPLLMARSGSVVVFDNTENIQYIGKSISGYSTHKETIHQGYSITLPIKEIDNE